MELTSKNRTMVQIDLESPEERRLVDRVVRDEGLPLWDSDNQKDIAGPCQVILITRETDPANLTAELLRLAGAWGHVTGAVIIQDTQEAAPENQTNVIGSLVTGYSFAQATAVLRQAGLVLEQRRELWNLRQTAAMSGTFDNIVGISEAIRQLKDTARRLAPTDIAITLEGPAGSGKKLLAEVIHHHSQRRNGPMVIIDFSAIPPMLLEQDLFGDSSSESNSRGSSLLPKACGGTVLLDKIHLVPPKIQSRLAEVIQTMSLGKDSSAPKLDCRFISTTEVRLDELVAAGKMERKLVDRLAVIPIKLPSLCDRAEDIEILVDYFLHRLSADLGRPAPAISREAVDKILQHNWPGNVRELENCLRRAVSLCHKHELAYDDITFLASGSTNDRQPARERLNPGGSRGKGLLDDNQRVVIRRALDEHNWNFTQTAQELGIGRTTLWRKVKKYKLKRSSSEETKA